MLDVIGPAEVFGDANRLRGGRPFYEIEIISACDDRTVTSHIGVPFIADYTFGETSGPIDTLLVAGGLGAREMRYSPKFLAWLKEKSKKVRRFGSVCTGALILADAGLLDGRRATTHWNWCGELARTHPRVKVDSNPIYVRDQELYTSAGVTAGVCHEHGCKSVVLYRRWEEVSRSRFTGAGFKPPSAAAFKRRGGERLGKRHHEMSGTD